MKEVSDHINNSAAEQLALLETLVNIDSGSEDVEGINAVADIVEKRLSALGLHVKRHSYEHAGDCLVAAGHGTEKKIVLLGHMDTVFEKGECAKRPYTVKDGKAYGPGVLDMKGGIAQIIYALESLQACGVSLDRIQVALVGDEEVGHEHSNAVEIFEELSRDASYVFCCESGRLNNVFVTERKGVAQLHLEAHGVAAHSGNDYSLGRSAISELCRKIIRLEEFTEPDLSLTVSAGRISGGGAVNIIPDYADALFDIRIKDFEKYKSFENALPELMKDVKHPEISCKYTLRLEYPSMLHSDKSEEIMAIVAKASERENLPMPKVLAVGGGADSSFFAMHNIPTVCAFGPYGEYNHRKDEYIITASLAERTRLLAACIQEILGSNAGNS